MLKLMGKSLKNPELTHKQKAKVLVFPDSKIKRFWDDIEMDCPYGRKINTRKIKRSYRLTTCKLGLWIHL